MTQPDAIEQPAHYNFGQMEAREIIELAIADFRDQTTVYHVASALKYLLRASRKNGADDIAKARKHIGWAEDAARAHELRALRNIPPPHYNPDDVAFRHGDIDQVLGIAKQGAGQPTLDTLGPWPPYDPYRECVGRVPAQGIRDAGEFTQPPNCAHPMAAEGLRMADEQPCNPPRRSESAWGVKWPAFEARFNPCPDSKPADLPTENQTLVGN